MTAFDQLVAEGHIDGRTSADTYFSSTLPEKLLNARTAGNEKAAQKSQRRGPSKRGAFLALIGGNGATRHRAFSPGLPGLVEFPFEEWGRLLGRRWRRPPRSFLVGNDRIGSAPERDCNLCRGRPQRPLFFGPIYHFLRRTKGIRPHRARADRSWRHRLDGRARIPRNARRPIGGRSKTRPVPVGDEGFSVTARQEIVPEAHLTCASPSR